MGKKQQIFLFVAGALVLMGLLLADKFLFSRAICEEGWPLYSQDYVVRSLLILLGSGLFFYGLTGGGAVRTQGCIATQSVPDRLSGIIVSMLGVSYLLLFLVAPRWFSRLSLEDGVIEMSAALFLIFGALWVGGGLIRHRQRPRVIRLSMGLLASILFILGMEEISWFQRVGAFQTPDLFENNIQNEINLHNFATNYCEVLFFFTLFLFACVLPVLHLRYGFWSKNSFVQVFMPRPFLVLPGALACAYNFDMWNNFFMQVAFYGSLVLLAILYGTCRHKGECRLLLFTFALVVLSQMNYLLGGMQYERIWEITEYREQLLGLTLFLYAVDVVRRVGRLAVPDASGAHAAA